MGRPPNTVARTKQIHATLAPLLEALGGRIPRDQWDALLMERYEIADEQIQRVTKGGEVLGFWRREPGKPLNGKGRLPGYIQFHRAAPATSPEAPPTAAELQAAGPARPTTATS